MVFYSASKMVLLTEFFIKNRFFTLFLPRSFESCTYTHSSLGSFIPGIFDNVQQVPVRIAIVIRVVSSLPGVSSTPRSFVCLCSRMFWPPMRTLPLGDPWIRGFYSISGGCRDSHLFYTTVHHGKQRCVLLTRLHLHPHARKHQPLARKRWAGLKLYPHLMCIIVP